VRVRARKYWRETTEGEVGRRPGGGEGLRVGGVELLHAFLEEDRERDRRDHERQHPVPEDRIDDDALEEQAEHDHRHHEAHEERGGEREPAELHRGEDEERRDHHELALGEVDRLRGLPEQHEADRDERVDAPGREARDEELQDVGHAGG
jgi:hypothetical protein